MQTFCPKELEKCGAVTFFSLDEAKTGSVRVTYHSGAFVQQLLQWKSNKYNIF